MDHLFLTGFMASGKSAVGRQLAKRLRRRFVDLDVEIEQGSGISVAEIFVRFGEREFRAREHRALEQVITGPPAIVATGGGVVVDPENRRLMRAHGKIVCLSASPDEIVLRVGDATSRPLLAGAASHEERRARVVALLGERAAFYADADHTIETSGKSVPEIVEAVAAWLGTRPAPNASSAT